MNHVNRDPKATGAVTEEKMERYIVESYTRHCHTGQNERFRVRDTQTGKIVQSSMKRDTLAITLRDELNQAVR
jgi:hypothetical protein